MAKPGDVYHDSEQNTHFMLEMELKIFDSYCIRILTKSHHLYGQPLAMVDREQLKQSRFTLVGRKAHIK